MKWIFGVPVSLAFIINLLFGKIVDVDQYLFTPAAPVLQKATEPNVPVNLAVFRNQMYGIEFRYPSDATISDYQTSAQISVSGEPPRAALYAVNVTVHGTNAWPYKTFTVDIDNRGMSGASCEDGFPDLYQDASVVQINGITFYETDSGVVVGSGSATRTRSYIAETTNSCYRVTEQITRDIPSDISWSASQDIGKDDDYAFEFSVLQTIMQTVKISG
jgi:hypothetical protein